MFEIFPKICHETFVGNFTNCAGFVRQSIILSRCNKFILGCEILGFQYAGINCCGKYFNEKPTLTPRGVCFTTKFKINGTALTAPSFYIDLHVSRNVSKGMYCNCASAVV